MVMVSLFSAAMDTRPLLKKLLRKFLLEALETSMFRSTSIEVIVPSSFNLAF